jgi:hypothetical protein
MSYTFDIEENDAYAIIIKLKQVFELLGFALICGIKQPLNIAMRSDEGSIRYAGATTWYAATPGLS